VWACLTSGEMLNPAMSNFLIEQRVCPRCGVQRTGRQVRSTTAFCFNCHHQWDAFRPTADAEAGYPFTGEERARLATYRAAVRVGFYTDW
jgi:hypothetical protein